jgi:membrane protein YqaA with SNARE-associated domain
MEIFVLGMTVGSVLGYTLGYTVRSLISHKRRRRFYS